MLSGAVDLTIQVERPELVEGTGVGSTLTECPHIFPESLTQELDGTLDEGPRYDFAIDYLRLTTSGYTA